MFSYFSELYWEYMVNGQQWVICHSKFANITDSELNILENSYLDYETLCNRPTQLAKEKLLQRISSMVYRPFKVIINSQIEPVFPTPRNPHLIIKVQKSNIIKTYHIKIPFEDVKNPILKIKPHHNHIILGVENPLNSSFKNIFIPYSHPEKLCIVGESDYQSDIDNLLRISSQTVIIC